MANEIPARITTRLKRALDAMREVRDSLDQGRTADRMFNGRGRYEADAWANTSKHLRPVFRTLEEFKVEAEAKGINGAAVLAALGGVPDVTLSAEALAWLHPPATRPLGTVWRYGLVLRPPGPGAVPREGLVLGSHRAEPLPRMQHGTVDYTRALTEQEVEHFDLVLVDVIEPAASAA